MKRDRSAASPGQQRSPGQQPYLPVRLSQLCYQLWAGEKKWTPPKIGFKNLRKKEMIIDINWLE